MIEKSLSAQAFEGNKIYYTCRFQLSEHRVVVNRIRIDLFETGAGGLSASLTPLNVRGPFYNFPTWPF